MTLSKFLLIGKWLATTNLAIAHGNFHFRFHRQVTIVNKYPIVNKYRSLILLQFPLLTKLFLLIILKTALKDDDGGSPLSNSPIHHPRLRAGLTI